MCTTVRHDGCSGAATGVVVAGVVVALAAFVGVALGLAHGGLFP